MEGWGLSGGVYVSGSTLGSFGGPNPSGLFDAWLARLNERGVPHSGITEQDMWDVLVFRDPDNVQPEDFTGGS